MPIGLSEIKKTGSWAEVDLSKIGDNLKNIKDSLSNDTKICCVLKANAYGHGATEVANYLQKFQEVDYIAVARIEEALELRREGIITPILCMGYTYIGDIDEAIKNRVTLTVYSLEMAKKLNEYAKKLGRKAKVHIKVDTGMSRLGFLVNKESAKDIREISKLENIELEGIYTHFANADMVDKTSVYKQLEKFKEILSQLEDVTIPIKHVSNSAGILDLKELGCTMVRLGISLYGYYPSEEVKKDIKLKPAMELKTILTNIKELPSGVGVSYGHDYITDKKTKIGTIAIGYGDGYPRTQDKPKVLINGKLVNIVGRVCMDQSMVELPDDLEVSVGDEVLVMGSEQGIRADDIAKRIKTINYEILCMISKRVVRYYHHGI